MCQVKTQKIHSQTVRERGFELPNVFLEKVIVQLAIIQTVMVVVVIRFLFRYFGMFFYPFFAKCGVFL